MNNRKQEVFTMLDSLTSKEIEDYIADRKIDVNLKKLLEKIKEDRPETHFATISNNINKKFVDIVNQYYQLGLAYVIALVLECFYDDKYKTKDIQSYLKAMMNSDNQLKEYVYDLMKDY